MKRVLITGANSYIGTSFERYIQEHYAGEFEVDTFDMIDGTWREKSFAEYDCVFHVAGIAHIKETKDNEAQYYIVNRDLAVEVAKKAKSDGVAQLVFLSSMSVYGLLQGHITQETECKPNTNYGKSKLQAENEILPLSDEYFKVCVLRPPMIYGKGCKGNYQTLVKIAKKLKFFLYVKNERSMLYIENLCEFVRLMIINKEDGIFFPQNSEYTNTSEMVKMIAAAHGTKLHLIHGFGWLVKFFGLFVKKIRKAFGSLIYDKGMSSYDFFSVPILLAESIDASERNE